MEKKKRLAIIVTILAILLITMAIFAIRNIRSRDKDLSDFLADISEGDGDMSMAGAPAVLLEKESEKGYESPPEEGKVFIVNRKYADPVTVRRAMKARGERFWSRVADGVRRGARGFIWVGGEPYLLGPFSLEDGSGRAHLLKIGTQKPVVAGEININSVQGEVISATLRLKDRGSYDVFIAREHPNVTLLFEEVRERNPSDRNDALKAILASYGKESG